MPIVYRFEEYCNSCEQLAPEVVKEYESREFGKRKLRKTTISCEHEKLCKLLKNHIAKEVTK